MKLLNIFIFVCIVLNSVSLARKNDKEVNFNLFNIKNFLFFLKKKLIF